MDEKIIQEEFVQTDASETDGAEVGEELLMDGPVVPKKKTLTREKKRKLFYICMIAFPILQFCTFYIYLNFSVIQMAFELYEETTFGYNVTYSFDNFKYVLNYMFQPTNVRMITNSLIWFVLHTFVGTFLALAFSYYIYKKYFFAEVFRVILFLPSIISSMVLVLLFKFIADDVYKAITNAGRLGGLLENPETRFGTLIFYNLWIGFGTNILLYCGAMSGINDSIVESAELDGTNSVQEFWYITLPMIYSTFTTFMVVAVSGIFIQGLNLYTFYATKAGNDIRTVGYFITLCTLQSNMTVDSETYFTYSQVSALGLLITLVTVPFSFGTRILMEKYGPSAK